MDDDVSVKRVDLSLDATVHILWVIVLIPGIIVLERVPFVVSVQAVLLDQGLQEKKKEFNIKLQMSILLWTLISSLIYKF